MSEDDDYEYLDDEEADNYEEDDDEPSAHTCYGSCGCEESMTYGETDKPGLEFRIRQKIIDLQDQLLKHYQKVQQLNDVDELRYTAMVEVLKAVLQ